MSGSATRLDDFDEKDFELVLKLFDLAFRDVSDSGFVSLGFGPGLSFAALLEGWRALARSRPRRISPN